MSRDPRREPMPLDRLRVDGYLITVIAAAANDRWVTWRGPRNARTTAPVAKWREAMKSATIISQAPTP